MNWKRKLSQLEQIYGTEDWAIKTNQRLECLVKRAYRQTGQKRGHSHR